MSKTPFETAREKRGWTYYAASQRMEGVSEQSLKNLERGVTPPDRVQVRTAVEIVKTLWPDVSLDDFYPDTPLRFAARDTNALRRLRYST